MKQFYQLALLGLALGLSACKDPLYVIDSYSTMRYDALALPAAADTLALNSVDFVSAREGFVGGAGGSLFATTDAGATWTRRSLASLGTITSSCSARPHRAGQAPAPASTAPPTVAKAGPA